MFTLKGPLLYALNFRKTRNMISRVCIVGLGLIGGSLAKLIREKSPKTFIVAVDSSPESLKQALDEGVIHQAIGHLSALSKDFDIVFTCTPIEITRETLITLLKDQPESCIVTDVASVKSPILEGLEPHSNLVGGHPMAGTEFSGYGASFAGMLYDAPYLLVPTPANTTALKILESFLKELGFRTGQLDAHTHDRHVATTSHLPYLAASIVSWIAEDVHPHPLLFGPGFASTTRVAKSNPEWGVSVCKTNQKALLEGLKAFQNRAQALETLIRCEDWDGLRLRFEQLSKFLLK